MTESNPNKNYIEKIKRYDKVQILINEKEEMVFEGIIDALYIKIHFDRIVHTSRYFDIIKMVGHHGKKSKEVIAEVIIGV